MQRLTEDVQREFGPGVTVWGKGDPAHQESPSDHNEDDTPGSKPAQTDADNIPEHRGIDIPFLGSFNLAKARVLRQRLTDRPANQARLRYVILEQTIWRKNGGWKREDYNGEFHNHLHVSGDANDDDNGAGWDIGPDKPTVPLGTGKEEDMYLIEANSNDSNGNLQKVVALVGSDGTVVGPVLFSDLKGGQATLNLWWRIAGRPSDNLTAAVWNDTMEMLGVDGWRYDSNFVLQVPPAK